VSGAIQAVAEGDHSSSSNATRLEFMTGASEAATTKMKLSSGGDLTVTSGDIIMGTSGKGIDFSATADSGGMASELLDDYEEGTWTASLSGSDSAPDSPCTTTGKYTKVGRIVHCHANIDNVNTTGASGSARITGLPFTVANSPMTGNVAFHTGFTFLSTIRNITPVAGETSTTIYFYQSRSEGSWTEVQHNAGAGAYLYVTVTYTT